MKKYLVLLLLLTMIHSIGIFAASYIEAQNIKNIERAQYWEQRGYNFDPVYMTAYTMDQKVKDIERAKYWKTKGYNFDPEYMTAYTMDQKVKDIKRAKYWKTKGYNFEPKHMTAYTMDQKVKDIKRAKYWKIKGYNFDPKHMTAYTMDQKAKKTKTNKIESAALMPVVTAAKELYKADNIIKATPTGGKKLAEKLAIQVVPNTSKQTTTAQDNNLTSNGKAYTCSELSRSEAYSLLSSGYTYLDRDGDGHPCEWGKVEGTYRSNCHYVNGYYRKSGTYVSGYTRCR